jgi:hypothetical protein
LMIISSYLQIILAHSIPLGLLDLMIIITLEKSFKYDTKV